MSDDAWNVPDDVAREPRATDEPVAAEPRGIPTLSVACGMLVTVGWLAFARVALLPLWLAEADALLALGLLASLVVCSVAVGGFAGWASASDRRSVRLRDAVYASAPLAALALLVVGIAGSAGVNTGTGQAGPASTEVLPLFTTQAVARGMLGWAAATVAAALAVGVPAAVAAAWIAGGGPEPDRLPRATAWISRVWTSGWAALSGVIVGVGLGGTWSAGIAGAHDARWSLAFAPSEAIAQAPIACCVVFALRSARTPRTDWNVLVRVTDGLLVLLLFGGSLLLRGSFDSWLWAWVGWGCAWVAAVAVGAFAPPPVAVGPRAPVGVPSLAASVLAPLLVVIPALVVAMPSTSLGLGLAVGAIPWIAVPAGGDVPTRASAILALWGPYAPHLPRMAAQLAMNVVAQGVVLHLAARAWCAVRDRRARAVAPSAR